MTMQKSYVSGVSQTPLPDMTIGEKFDEVAGRMKDMIIRGGENIYPREIEEFLYPHEAVSDAQVISVPDGRYGEEVRAWVKLAVGKQVSEEDLRDFCKASIAHYKVPNYIKLVEEFPMTVTGKIQKFRMREISIDELNPNR